VYRSYTGEELIQRVGRSQQAVDKMANQIAELRKAGALACDTPKLAFIRQSTINLFLLTLIDAFYDQCLELDNPNIHRLISDGPKAKLLTDGELIRKRVQRESALARQLHTADALVFSAESILSAEAAAATEDMAPPVAPGDGMGEAKKEGVKDEEKAEDAEEDPTAAKEAAAPLAKHREQEEEQKEEEQKRVAKLEQRANVIYRSRRIEEKIANHDDLEVSCHIVDVSACSALTFVFPLSHPTVLLGRDGRTRLGEDKAGKRTLVL
jgi:hypothetical protein